MASETDQVLVVFDIDGTLTDSVAQHQSAFETALRGFDFPDLNTDWASYRHHTDSGIFAEAWNKGGFDGTPDQQGLEALFCAAFDATLMNWPMKEIAGASALMDRLTETAVPFGFATGSLRHGALRKLSILDASVSDRPLTTASEYETREAIVGKSITAIRAASGAAPGARIVSIGDGLWDLKTARALGLDFIGIGTGPKADQLRAEGADVFDDLSATTEILTRIETGA